MRLIKIPKGNGRVRVIYVPDKDERRVLYRILPYLDELQEQLCGDWVHAFRWKRSPVTNALAHRGRDYSLSIDLADFFDSVRVHHLAPFLPSGWLREVGEGGILYHGAPRQGLPTSPAAANIAALPMDKRIMHHLETIGLPQAVYTRYADDITISWCGDRDYAGYLKEKLPSMIASEGFEIAHHKTRLQSSRNGRRVICGVAVDDCVHPTRSARRKLRTVGYRCKQLEMVLKVQAAFLGERPPPFDALVKKSYEGLRAWCEHVEGVNYER